MQMVSPHIWMDGLFNQKTNPIPKRPEFEERNCPLGGRARLYVRFIRYDDKKEAAL